MAEGPRGCPHAALVKLSPRRPTLPTSLACNWPHRPAKKHFRSNSIKRCSNEHSSNSQQYLASVVASARPIFRAFRVGSLPHNQFVTLTFLLPSTTKRTYPQGPRPQRGLSSPPLLSIPTSPCQEGTVNTGGRERTSSHLVLQPNRRCTERHYCCCRLSNSPCHVSRLAHPQHSPSSYPSLRVTHPTLAL